MRLTAKQTKLIAPRVQVIEISDGVIVKRGATEFMIAGSGAAESVKKVLDAAASPGASVEDIHRLFDRSSIVWVDKLIQQLRSRRLLVEESDRASPINGEESALDVFNWQLGEVTERVIERLNKVRIVIIGVNAVSKQLAIALGASGCRNVSVFDHPAHRGQEVGVGGVVTSGPEWPKTLAKPQSWDGDHHLDLGDCLVATSDLGGQQALCQWNALCLSRGTHFLPALIRNMVGYVGPMVIPGETACYECLISRQLSHSTYPNAELCTNRLADVGQTMVGFHPSMAAMVGAVTAFEISRFYGFPESDQAPGRFLEINLLAGSMIRRTVLKIPRCPACSPFRKVSQPNLAKVLFTKQTLKGKATGTMP